MVHIAESVIFKIRKVSEGYQYQEVLIRVPRSLWEDPRFPLDLSKKRRQKVIIEFSEDKITISKPPKPP